MFGWTLVKTWKWRALRADLWAAQGVVDRQRAEILRLLNEKSKLEAEIWKAKEKQ